MPSRQAPQDDFTTATLGRWKLGLNALRDAHANLPGSQARVAATIDATNKLTPPGGDLTVDTFQAAASDFLDFISLGAVDDGVSVAFGIASVGRKVTLRHLMSSPADTDAGPLFLRDGEQQGDALLLDDTILWMRFQRVGSVFVERERHGFKSDTPIGKQNVDLAGFALLGARFDPVEVFQFPFSFRRSLHLARLTVFQADGTATLPNPNDVTDPNTAEYWRQGDTLPWHAMTARLLFRRWDGPAPASTLNHDMAYGRDALGACVVARDAGTNTLFWTLGGATGVSSATLLASPAPAPPPPPARVWKSAKAPGDTSLANDLTWQSTGTTLSHSYGANEKWVYLVSLGIAGGGTSANNAARIRLVRNTGSDVVVGSAGRGRFPNDSGRFGIVYGTQYGSTAGSATYRVEAANAATGFLTTVQAPLIVGLQLLAGEDVAHSATGASDGAAAWTTVTQLAAFTPAAAGTFLVVAGMETTASSASDLYDVRLAVDGTAVFPLNTAATDSPRSGSYTTVFPVALAAGAHAIALQIRAHAAGATTATGINATVVVLDPAQFSSAAYDMSPSAQASTTATYTNRLGESWALRPGWFSLVIGSQQWYVAATSASSDCQVRLRRNGAALVPDARSGVGTALSWVPSSYFGMAVVTPALATDGFALDFASSDGSTEVRTSGSALLALPLGP